MKGNKIISVLVVLFLVASSFAGVASADSGIDKISSSVENDIDWRGNLDVNDDVVRYGNSGNPSFIVTVSDANKSNTLQSWANESEERDIRSQLTENKSLVVAPSNDVLQKGWFTSSGLWTKSYITSVDYNSNVGIIEPVSSVENENVSTLTKYATNGEFGVGQSSSVNESTIADVRQNVGVNDVSVTGNNTTVGIIDTGLTEDSNLYQSRVSHAKNFVNNTTGISNVTDGNGHGDWVASAIAADPDPNTSGEQFEGIAPDANLTIAKAMANDGSGSTADIIQAVEWTCERSDVVSMSLGSPMYSESIADAVRDCVDTHNTTVVIAVGNSGENPATMYVASPADTDSEGIISVGASTNEIANNSTIATFSQVGPDRGIQSTSTAGESPDVAAPGMQITVKTADGNSTLSGTSMATPITSGVIALGMEQDSSLKDNPSDVRERIYDTSERMPNAAVQETQSGLIDADNFVSNTSVEKSQNEVMNEKAFARNRFYETYSTSRVISTIESIGDWF